MHAGASCRDEDDDVVILEEGWEPLPASLLRPNGSGTASHAAKPAEPEANGQQAGQETCQNYVCYIAQGLVMCD